MASFEIGARGLFNFRNELFFLLVEDEITVPDKCVEIEPVNIYEIDTPVHPPLFFIIAQPLRVSVY